MSRMSGLIGIMVYMLNLTLVDLYRELDIDPDLRRLGKYKVIHADNKPILSISINLEGRDVNLGEGDFRETFTAFDTTVARSLDLGSSIFTEVYLDRIRVDTLRLSGSKSSRFFFDYAKVENCEFGSFDASEVYFDWSEIENIFVQDLRAGIIYLGTLKTKYVDGGEIDNERFRFSVDSSGTDEFGDFIVLDEEEDLNEGESFSEGEIRVLTEDEFIDQLKLDPDLRRLGRYRVLPDNPSSTFRIQVDYQGREIRLGEGDFSLANVSLGDISVERINFDSSRFGELGLGSLVAKRMDLCDSQIGVLRFDQSEIGECFLANFYGHKVFGGQSSIGVLYGEGGNVKEMDLEYMRLEQFHVNHLVASELKLGKSRVRELSMSAEKGIQKLYCDESKLWLLNLHESSLSELNFGNSEISKALINKCSVEIVRCDNLKAELFYIGNDGKNELGLVDFELAKGIKNIEVEKIVPNSGENKTGERHIFKKLSFGVEPENLGGEMRRGLKRK